MGSAAGADTETSRAAPSRRSPSWRPTARVLRRAAFALVVGAVLLTVSGDPVFDTYQRMWDRSFGTADTLSATINRAVPLALAGLAVSIAATMGLWNIGAEGQIMFGATAATLVGRIGADWPSPVLITAMLIGAAIGGALWALGPGLAKARSVSARSSRHSCSTRSPFGSSCTCKPVPGKTLMVSASPDHRQAGRFAAGHHLGTLAPRRPLGLGRDRRVRLVRESKCVGLRASDRWRAGQDGGLRRNLDA